ncbi:hypothetical protein AB833_07620 [Chromatiales bacterium (ex Bugula neritina AB1)]|nr:hypothetical protein AB833_07620 [Chromatiales bacterium (ex Bugula neritina AB1)]
MKGQTKNPNDNDDEWLKQITNQLDASADSVDFVTSSRLSAARARAIALPRRPNWLNPFTSVTAAAAMCFVVYTYYPFTSQQPDPMMASEDLPIFSSNVEIEFIESLEFLEWMDETEEPVSSG